MNYTETVEITLVIETCIECGVKFGLPEELYRQVHIQKGKNFYCPNGHSMIYGDTVEEQLKRAKKDAQWWRDEAERTGRQLSSTRGVVTRLKNRIANGVCPCCHRQFVNLHRHMITKHPDFKNEPG